MIATLLLHPDYEHYYKPCRKMKKKKALYSSRYDFFIIADFDIDTKIHHFPVIPIISKILYKVYHVINVVNLKTCIRNLRFL